MTDSEFRGEALEIAEVEFGALLADDLPESLCKEWRHAGAPDPEPWLRTRFGELFQAVGERPRWIRQEDCDWQYQNGKPMMFLGQMDLPQFRFPTGQICSPTRIFLFATAEAYPTVPGAWTMEIKVVHRNLEEGRPGADAGPQ